MPAHYGTPYEADADRLMLVWRVAKLSFAGMARLLGLPDNEMLLKIARGRAPLTKELADRLAARFPQIDARWLKTGKFSHRGKADGEGFAPLVVPTDDPGPVVSGDPKAVREWKAAKAREAACAWQVTVAWMAWEKARQVASAKARKAKRMTACAGGVNE